MNYTDLHCDTALEIYLKKENLCTNSLHIDLEKAKIYENYTQIFAIWSENDKTDDENYSDFFKIKDYFANECIKNNIILCRNLNNYADKNINRRAILAVEGGKLLGNSIDRLDKLAEVGVKFLTLVWSGICSIGGAFDTDKGLTDFGKLVIKRCEDLNIIVDLSHSSDKTIADVFNIANKPVVATHSNSRSVFFHKRNLTDEQFLEIKKRGGIVGVSLCKPHLGDEPVFMKNAIKHIDYYMSLGGENCVSFGCDFDGAPLPEDIQGVQDIIKIAEELNKLGYNNDLIENIMYKNANNFINKNLI